MGDGGKCIFSQRERKGAQSLFCSDQSFTLQCILVPMKGSILPPIGTLPKNLEHEDEGTWDMDQEWDSPSVMVHSQGFSEKRGGKGKKVDGKSKYKNVR